MNQDNLPFQTNITLEDIWAKNPCSQGWKALLGSLNKEDSDDTIISIENLLTSNSISDTLWVLWICLDGELDKKRNICCDFSEMAIEAVSSVLHNFENKYPDDKRPREAIKLSQKYVDTIRNNNDISAIRLAYSEALSASSASSEALWEAGLAHSSYLIYLACSATLSAAESETLLAARSAARSARSADSAAYLTEDLACSAAYLKAESAADTDQKLKNIILKYFR